MKHINLLISGVAIGIMALTSCSSNPNRNDGSTNLVAHQISVAEETKPEYTPKTEPTTEEPVGFYAAQLETTVCAAEVTTVTAAEAVTVTTVANSNMVATPMNESNQENSQVWEWDNQEAYSQNSEWSNSQWSNQDTASTSEYSEYYYVQPGDSWSSIADYLWCYPEDLAAANYMSLDDIICPGDKLIIPTSSSSYSSNAQQSNYYTNYEEPYTSNSGNASGTCLSSVTLYPTSSGASWHNIELSLSELNGMTMNAGDYFSWNNYIGWKTVSGDYGYWESTVYVGDQVGTAYGGGVCCTSTALFQAARAAGMEVYERHDHSLPVAYATPGNEASVSYGCWDLQFSNSTGYDVVFYTSCYPGCVTIECYVA